MSSVKLTAHFTREELQCDCCKQAPMESAFLARLEEFRVKWGKPMNITSGYRCQKENERVGGVPGSMHLRGRAVDVAVSPLDRYAFVKLAYDVGFTGIGIGKNFIHVDDRENGCNLWKYG